MIKTAMHLAVASLTLAVVPGRACAEKRIVDSAKGGVIQYHIDGSGPVVVMIPSLGRGAADFDDLARRMVTAGFTTVRPEPRGIGESLGEMNGLTLHDLASDTAAVITALGAKPVIVVAHAFGQRVARVLASDHPELVKGLAMIAAGGKAPMRPGAQQALMGSFELDQPLEKRMRDVKFAFFAPDHDPMLWRDGWYPAAAKAQIAASQATPVIGWWNAGSKTQLLVLQGLQDTVAPPENGHMMKADLGDRVELIDIDGAGHAMLPEQPEKIATAIIAFAKKIEANEIH